ncbi:MAG TPA: universal stress protein [Thermoleophilaceae bacterium]
MRFEPPFTTIVCGIDGSRAALEGARQAAALAAAEASVELVAIITDPLDPDARSGIDEATADAALEEASHEVAVTGAYVVTRKLVSEGRFVWDKLLEAAADADLLVLGRHSRSRPPRIGGAKTTTNILERAQLPVLSSVAPPTGRPFPGRILVGAAGAGHPEHAVALATAIARRSGRDVVLVRAANPDTPLDGAVGAAVADLREAIGAPIEVVAEGWPPHVIAEYAEREHASLVITGSRGKNALGRLRSVSIRVAQAAPCSVLVVPTAEPDDQAARITRS